MTIGWAVLMRSENRLDGKREYFLGMTDHPCRHALFNTRSEAREFIEKQFGYQRNRPDLRAEPHGWKMPLPVKVRVILEPV